MEGKQRGQEVRKTLRDLSSCQPLSVVADSGATGAGEVDCGGR